MTDIHLDFKENIPKGTLLRELAEDSFYTFGGFLFRLMYDFSNNPPASKVPVLSIAQLRVDYHGANYVVTPVDIKCIHIEVEPE